MAYMKCKIWSFSDEINHQEACYEAMKAGHKYHAVKVLIDTTSNENFISESLANKLGKKYSNHYKNKKVKNSLGTIECLELSFQYKGKDRLVGSSDEVLNDFEVIEKPKADLILGMQWLWLREVKIDIRRGGIRIYGNFIPFYSNETSFDFSY